MRRRSRAGGDSDIGQQVERHFRMEWLVADRFDIDVGDTAPVNLAPHSQPACFGKVPGGDMRASKRFGIHVPPGWKYRCLSSVAASRRLVHHLDDARDV